MSIGELLLAFLESSPSDYRALRDMLVYPTKPRYIRRKKVSVSEGSFANTLSRLKKQGFVSRGKGGQWHITQKGKEKLGVLKAKIKFPEHLPKQRAQSLPDTIIIFDIPEVQRVRRNWLRIELALLGFSMLQKSVWLGAGPLPERFLENIRDLSLMQSIHIFSIKKTGTLARK